MKVEELIKRLNKCNPDADVEIIDIAVPPHVQPEM